VLAWRERAGDPERPGAPQPRFAVTDRHGGLSGAPYATLNLGVHVGDDPGAVAENRRRLAATVGVTPERLIFMSQMHGADVAVVSEPWRGDPPEVDALVTREPGLALAVLAADCAPVLLADHSAGVVAAAHAGRKGLLAGVVPATLTAMERLGARAASTLAAIGPAACGACYEVPAEMQQEVATRFPAAHSTTSRGTPGLDLPAAVVAALTECGVQVRPGPRSAGTPRCTIEDGDLYSYRRDRTTGRFAGLAWITDADG
jgi:YfiH family protein